MSTPSQQVTAGLVSVQPGSITIEGTTSTAPAGGVGVAFSGGGSRACIAAMGQLRRLKSEGWLAQVGAISSASGGSWCLVPYTWLPTSLSDEDLLGEYSAPGDLTTTAGTGAKHNVTHLATTNLCSPMTHYDFSMPGLLSTAAGLLVACGTRAWPVLISERLLEPVGLWQADKDHYPTSWFTADATTYASIVAANPDLGSKTCHQVREPTGGDGARPFYICTTALFTGENVEMTTLAPVQATPWFTGVLGSCDIDANGDQVGGGWVQSFGFGGTRVSQDGDSVTVEQPTALSLGDITGASSAFWATSLNLERPAYGYFPIDDTTAAGGPVDFADGGNLDNSAVAALLAYAEITSVISFVSGDDGVSVDDQGITVIDECIPPLFGFQPYQAGLGYLPYGKGDNKDAKYPQYRHNQVFSSDDFQTLLDALANSTNGTCLQTEVTVVDNAWFGVVGGRTVDVQWVQLTACSDWNDQLQPDVDAVLEDIKDFPNYPLLDTERTVEEINLLANFTGWILGQSDAGSLFG